MGYFESYARGDWGVGSDLDLVVSGCGVPFTRRATCFDTTTLRILADLLIYTMDRWEVVSRRGRFGWVLFQKTVRLFERIPGMPSAPAGILNSGAAAAIMNASKCLVAAEEVGGR